jgi:hypothetical protein
MNNRILKRHCIKVGICTHYGWICGHNFVGGMDMKSLWKPT